MIALAVRRRLRNALGDHKAASAADLAVVMVISTLAGSSFSLSFTLLSLALRDAGFDLASIGWSAAGHGLGVLVSAPFYAGLIARIGVIQTMRHGLVIAALAMLLLPLWVDPVAWFFGRMIMGAAGTAVFIVTEAAVNAMIDDKRRGRVLGIYAAFFCIGYATGPLIVAIVGANGYLPFALGAALLLFGLWPVSKAKATARSLDGHGHAMILRDMLAVWRVAPLPIATIFVFGFVEMALMSLFPIYAIGRGVSQPMAAALVGVWIAGNIVLQFPIGWAADRWPKFAVLLGLAVVSALLVLSLLALDGPVFWLWPVMTMMGAAMGGLYTLSLALLGMAFKGGELTIANTAFIMAIEIGVLLGPPAGGVLMQIGGDDLLVYTIVAALACLLLFALRNRHPTHQPRV